VHAWLRAPRERGMQGDLDLILTHLRSCPLLGHSGLGTADPSRGFIDTLPASTRRSNVRADIVSLW
jgi:hypothetical protein